MYSLNIKDGSLWMEYILSPFGYPNLLNSEFQHSGGRVDNVIWRE